MSHLKEDLAAQKRELLEERTRNKRLGRDSRKLAEQLKGLRSAKMALTEGNFQLQTQLRELEKDHRNLQFEMQGPAPGKAFLKKSTRPPCDFWWDCKALA